MSETPRTDVEPYRKATFLAGELRKYCHRDKQCDAPSGLLLTVAALLVRMDEAAITAESRATTAEQQLAAARDAARLVADIFREDRGDIDGGWLQDKAVEHGVLIEVEATEPCVDPEIGNCACAEYGDFPMTCYRLNPAIDAASGMDEGG